MNIEMAWREINKESPNSTAIMDLINVPLDLKKDFLSKFISKFGWDLVRSVLD